MAPLTMIAWIGAIGIGLYVASIAVIIAILRLQVHMQPPRRWRSSALLLIAASVRIIDYIVQLTDNSGSQGSKWEWACYLLEECAAFGAQSLAVYHWSRFLVPPRSPASASLRRRIYLTINSLTVATAVGGLTCAAFFFSPLLKKVSQYAFASVLVLTAVTLLRVVFRIRKRLLRFRAAARHVRALRQMWRILSVTIATACFMLWHATSSTAHSLATDEHILGDAPASYFFGELLRQWLPDIGIYSIILFVMSGSRESRRKALPLEHLADSAALETGDGPRGVGNSPLLERRSSAAPLLAGGGSDGFGEDSADADALLPAERIASVIMQDEDSDGDGGGAYVAPTMDLPGAHHQGGRRPGGRAPLGAAPTLRAALAHGTADSDDSDNSDNSDDERDTSGGGRSRALAAHLALSWDAEALPAGIVALRAVCVRAPGAAGKPAVVLGGTDAQPVGRGASSVAIPVPMEPCPLPEAGGGVEVAGREEPGLGAAAVAASALTRFRTSCDTLLLVMGVTALDAPVVHKRSVVGVCLGTLPLPRHSLLSPVWAAHVPLAPACAGLQGLVLQSALRAACRGDLWTAWGSAGASRQPGAAAASLVAAAGPEGQETSSPAAFNAGDQAQGSGTGRAALAALGLSTQSSASGLALALHAAGVLTRARTPAGTRVRGAKAPRDAEGSGDGVSPQASTRTPGASLERARDGRKASRSHPRGDVLLWADAWVRASSAVVAALVTAHGATVQVRQGSNPAALLGEVTGNGAVSDSSSEGEGDEDAEWAEATARAEGGRSDGRAEQEEEKEEEREQGRATAALEAHNRAQLKEEQERWESAGDGGDGLVASARNLRSPPRAAPRRRGSSLGEEVPSAWEPLRGPLGEDVWSLAVGESSSGPLPVRLRRALAQLHAVTESPSMQFRVAAVTTGTSARQEVDIRVYSMRCAKHGVPSLAPPSPGSSGQVGAAAFVSGALAARRARRLHGALHTRPHLPLVRARSMHPRAADVLGCAPYSARLVEMAVLLAREAADGRGEAEEGAAAALWAFDTRAFAAGAAAERYEMEGAAAAAGLCAPGPLGWPRIAPWPRNAPPWEGVADCEGLLPALVVGKALCASRWASVQAAAHHASRAGRGGGVAGHDSRQPPCSVGGGGSLSPLEPALRVCGPAPRPHEAGSTPAGGQWWACSHAVGDNASGSATGHEPDGDGEAGNSAGGAAAGSGPSRDPGTEKGDAQRGLLSLSALPRVLPSLSTCGGAAVLTPPQASTCLTLAEVLVEGRFCWRVPQLLLQLLLEEHKAELQRVEGDRATVEHRVCRARDAVAPGTGFIGLEALVSDMKGSEVEDSIVEWMKARVELEKEHIELLTTAMHLCGAGRCRGHSFRLSVTKKDMPLQYTPTNLHVHWTCVADASASLDAGVGVLGTPPCAAVSPHQALVLPPSLRASLASHWSNPSAALAPGGEDGGRRDPPRVTTRPRAASEIGVEKGSGLQLPRWQATSAYPTVTVGAFSAHGCGHKAGGIGGLRRSAHAARLRLDDSLLHGALGRALQQPHAEAGTVKHLLVASVFGHPCPMDESTSAAEVEQARAGAVEAARSRSGARDRRSPAFASLHRSDLVTALTDLHAMMLDATQHMAQSTRRIATKRPPRTESALTMQQGMAWNALQALRLSTRQGAEAALRSEMCFSQALGAMAEGAAAVFQHELSQSPLAAARAAQRWAAVGLLLQMECLLSTMGKEASMISDHFHAMRCLDGVDIELCIMGRRAYSAPRREDQEEEGQQQRRRRRRRRQRAMRRGGLCDGPTLVEGAAAVGRARHTHAGGAAGAGDLFPEAVRLDPRDAALRLDGSTGRLILSLVARVSDPTLRAVAAQLPSNAVAGKEAGPAAAVVVAVGVHAVTVAQGVNEVQSVANMRGVALLQEAVNADALPRIRAYCERFNAFYRDLSGAAASAAAVATVDHAVGSADVGVGAPSSEVLSDTVQAEVDAGCSASTVGRAIEALEKRLARVEAAEKGPKKEKNVRLLVEAAGLARAVGGVRLTCCKSGKDRTGMSVTYEQARLLQERHALAQGDVKEAMDVTRGHGVRRANCGKNTGSDRFAFNKFQRRMLPPELKPPTGCGGSKVT